MTMGEEGNSSGSESEPSADNLDEEEMAQIVPIKLAKKPPTKKDDKKGSKKIAPISKKPKSPKDKRPEIIKEISRSPTKKPSYNPFDRLSLRGKRKPEMKDAWTQTTPKSKEQLDKERREHR